jgi:predicted lipoprotein with Yx(FWY)xxD motif
MRRLSFIGSIATAAALLIAGCGGGGTNNGNSSASAPAQSPSGNALVNSTNTASLGNIVVGPTGRTLYLFKKDTGPSSTCSGACAAAWPPLTTKGAVTSSGDVSMSALKTVRRSDGTMQVTLDGHPLYYYAGDSAPGQANGQGLTDYGAAWWALSPSGKEITVGGGPHGGY